MLENTALSTTGVWIMNCVDSGMEQMRMNKRLTVDIRVTNTHGICVKTSIYRTIIIICYIRCSRWVLALEPLPTRPGGLLQTKRAGLTFTCG